MDGAGLENGVGGDVGNDEVGVGVLDGGVTVDAFVTIGFVGVPWAPLPVTVELQPASITTSTPSVARQRSMDGCGMPRSCCVAAPN